MNYRLLLTVFLTSLGSLALAPIAVAQERPKCYLIEPSGQLVDLTEICNASQRRSPENNPSADEDSNITNDNYDIISSQPGADDVLVGDRGFVLERDNIAFRSGIDSAYYIDNEIGMDYTAYTRRYSVPSTSIVRPEFKERVFQFDTRPNSLTSILRQGQSRIPFIIYRYQK